MNFRELGRIWYLLSGLNGLSDCRDNNQGWSSGSLRHTEMPELMKSLSEVKDLGD